jgi:hypothetical protein
LSIFHNKGQELISFEFLFGVELHFNPNFKQSKLDLVFHRDLLRNVKWVTADSSVDAYTLIITKVILPVLYLECCVARKDVSAWFKHMSIGIQEVTVTLGRIQEAFSYTIRAN